MARHCVTVLEDSSKQCLYGAVKERSQWQWAAAHVWQDSHGAGRTSLCCSISEGRELGATFRGCTFENKVVSRLEDQSHVTQSRDGWMRWFGFRQAEFRNSISSQSCPCGEVRRAYIHPSEALDLQPLLPTGQSLLGGLKAPSSVLILQNTRDTTLDWNKPGRLQHSGSQPS